MKNSLVVNRIEQSISSFNNNSLIIRYVLAILVFYSHMFSIYGLPEPTLFWGKHSLGWYAVNGFFFISGLLVAQSYHNRGVFSYFAARFLRIMPAYLLSLIVVLLAVFFFSDIQFNIKWVVKFLKFLFQNIIPLDSADVSMEGAWINTGQPNALNNSLWTIPFEIFCYIIIIPLFLSNNRFSPKFLLLFIIIVLIYLNLLEAISFNHISLDLLRVIIYFIIDVTLYISIKEKRINIYFLFSCLILFVFEGNFKETLLGYVIILSILYLGFYVKSIIKTPNDYSYGLYIYAWPISQSVKGMGIENINHGLFVAFIILLIISWVSWKYLEKPSLKLKNKI
ncbi:acyltransferase family protein [Aliarcobacter butzleri]|uniref:acyltransferase family protein n=1 Tax=Aliarcobacter butzleri TaxID=28197 RepID=UPI0034508062